MLEIQFQNFQSGKTYRILTQANVVLSSLIQQLLKSHSDLSSKEWEIYSRGVKLLHHWSIEYLLSNELYRKGEVLELREVGSPPYPTMGREEKKPLEEDQSPSERLSSLAKRVASGASPTFADSKKDDPLDDLAGDDFDDDLIEETQDEVPATSLGMVQEESAESLEGIALDDAELALEDEPSPKSLARSRRATSARPVEPEIEEELLSENIPLQREEYQVDNLMGGEALGGLGAGLAGAGSGSGAMGGGGGVEEYGDEDLEPPSTGGLLEDEPTVEKSGQKQSFVDPSAPMESRVAFGSASTSAKSGKGSAKKAEEYPVEEKPVEPVETSVGEALGDVEPEGEGAKSEESDGRTRLDMASLSDDEIADDLRGKRQEPLPAPPSSRAFRGLLKASGDHKKSPGDHEKSPGDHEKSPGGSLEEDEGTLLEEPPAKNHGPSIEDKLSQTPPKKEDSDSPEKPAMKLSIAPPRGSGPPLNALASTLAEEADSSLSDTPILPDSMASTATPAPEGISDFDGDSAPEPSPEPTTESLSEPTKTPAPITKTHPPSSREISDDLEDGLTLAKKPLAPPKPKPAKSMAVSKKKEKAPPVPPKVPPLPEKKDQEVAEGTHLERKTTVRYYSQMHPSQNFPLLVVISKEEIEKLQRAGVVQKTAKKAFAVKKVKPIVEIIPHFPGCICTPGKISVNVTPERVEAKMWVTPLCEGDLKEARVEVWYEGNKVNEVKTPCKVTTQAVAKFMGALSFFAPFIASLLQAFHWDLESQVQEGFPLVKGALKILSIPYITGIFLVFFVGLTVLFYLRNRPKEADPVTEFFGVKAKATEETEGE